MSSSTSSGSQAVSSIPTLHLSNITNSPVTSILGALTVAQGVLTPLVTTGFPVTGAGWIPLVSNLAIGLLGLFIKGV